MNFRITKPSLYICLLLSVIGCNNSEYSNKIYKSNSLEVQQLSKNVFVHITYLNIPNYGFFPCNGMIYTSGKEAIIFDTPSEDSVALELIKYLQEEMNVKIIAVVINHFHIDCLGSLQVFHDKGIPSYANSKTIEAAKKENTHIPMRGFNESQTIHLGGKEIQNTFLGEAHTKDNIVSYLVDEKVLFGGCMIKEVGAGKGNVKDANIEEWASTVKKVQENFPKVKHIIPGHGAIGGEELLDYTIELFIKKNR